MNLWLLTQTTMNGYDTYDSAVVVAETEEAARNTHPSAIANTPGEFGSPYRGREEGWGLEFPNGRQAILGGGDWPPPSHVTATFLGPAVDITPRVVCASFNAG